jgi:hypothetical protein
MSDLHHPAMPAEFKEFSQHPFLLPGESRREFETIRRMIIDEIRPGTNIEWLWTLDLVDLSWEILRYRRLKQKTLEAFRLAAVEALLQRVEGLGLPADATLAMQAHTRQNVSQWREDPDAAAEIEAHLKKFGFDAVAMNAEVYVQARDQLEMFDHLMQRAQQRRMVLLREISIRREFARRAERISDAAIEGGLLRVRKGRS